MEDNCRIASRSVVPVTEPLGCLAARGDPPDEDLEGAAAYADWLESSGPAWAVHQIEELLEEGLDSAQFACRNARHCRQRSPEATPPAFDRSATEGTTGNQLGRREHL